MAKSLEVSTVPAYSKDDVARAMAIMADVARQIEEEKKNAAEKVQEDAVAKFQTERKQIKDFIKKGLGNPSWLARELKITVQRAEAILRDIQRETEAERAREFLKIPGLPG